MNLKNWTELYMKVVKSKIFLLRTKANSEAAFLKNWV